MAWHNTKADQSVTLKDESPTHAEWRGVAKYCWPSSNTVQTRHSHLHGMATIVGQSVSLMPGEGARRQPSQLTELRNFRRVFPPPRKLTFSVPSILRSVTRRCLLVFFGTGW